MVKIPRFTFEKFPQADPILTTQMKSVGEAMAIGRTFKEALQKALRSLEIGRFGLGGDGKDKYPLMPGGEWDRETIQRQLTVPTAERIFAIRHALLAGFTVDEFPGIYRASTRGSCTISANSWMRKPATKPTLRPFLCAARRSSVFPTASSRISRVADLTEADIRQQRQTAGLLPTYRLVDTCAAEFEAYTPYYYSTYGDEDETRGGEKRKVMILGGGPNRIGQGIEFDYCCCHAAFALKEEGFETVMVNSNPETVSTDYDTSDKLYFEPLTLEDVLNIYEREKCWGVIVQFGGQTPLNLAADLQKNGVNIIGTQPASIELAEDRKHFAALLEKLRLLQPPNGNAVNEDEAVVIANRIGYPVLVRPSFVLGGRAMEIVYAEDDLRRYMRAAVAVSPDRPILVDRFLEDATEVDVDCLSDGETIVLGAIMEHIEQAGIHSGDSACVIPPFSLSDAVQATITEATKSLARELKGQRTDERAVRRQGRDGLRAGGQPPRLAHDALRQQGHRRAFGETGGEGHGRAANWPTSVSRRKLRPKHFSVKEAVFPFVRFPGVDITLGPEMKSTGEVMGIDADLGLAYAKSQMAAGSPLPLGGNLFISVKDADKPEAVKLAAAFVELGFQLYATGGTAAALAAAGVPVKKLFKLTEGRPHVLDMIKNGEIAFIINTPSGKNPRRDEVVIRGAAVAYRIPIMTTLSAAAASVGGIRSLQVKGLNVKPLQEYHANLATAKRG